MKKIILVCILTTTLLVGCAKEESSSEENQTNITEFSYRVSLFNAIEDLIEILDKKKDYVEIEEEMENVFLKSNQVGYINNRQNEDSIAYITTINNLAKMVGDAARKQKETEIGAKAQKSMLSLESGSQSQASSGDSETEGESGEGGDSGGEEETKAEDIILYDEELAKEYPEATMTAEDYAIKDTIISLMDFITKETLLVFPNNEKALINREKYLFYKIESLCRNNMYISAVLLIDEININWQTLTNTVENMDPTEAKTISTYINNIENAINSNEYMSIKYQCSGVIKELEKQLSKPKEE